MAEDKTVKYTMLVIDGNGGWTKDPMSFADIKRACPNVVEATLRQRLARGERDLHRLKRKADRPGENSQRFNNKN